MGCLKYIFCAVLFLGLLGNANSAIKVEVSSPTDGNYSNDNLIAVVFTVLDDNASMTDLNAYIYYDTTQGGTSNVIVEDLNLLEGLESGTLTYCDGTDFTATRTCHYNWDVSGVADNNYYIDVNVVDWTGGCVWGTDSCTNADTNNDSNSFVLDKTAPIVYSDANQSWQNFDANVATTCSDSVADVNSIAINFNSIGFQFYTGVDRNWFIQNGDGNFSLTFFCSDMAGNATDQNTVYVTVDKTAPTNVSITVPDHPQAPSVLVSYSATDATSGIRKYWVSIDGTTYVDNSLNTTYQVGCTPGHTTVFYLKVNDNADNNSTLTTANVGCEERGGPPFCGDGECSGNETAATCPRDCQAVCGDGACTHTESVESCPIDCVGCGDNICSEDESCLTCEVDCGKCPTVGKRKLFEKRFVKKPTPAEIESVLVEAGASETAIERAKEAVGKTSVERTIVVEEITAEDGSVSYETTVTIVVKNASEKRLRNVKVVEKIPKSVAANASMVKSGLEFDVLKAEPIIRFTVSELRENSFAEIDYSVGGKVDETALGEWVAPIVVDFEAVTVQEGACSVDSDCTDANPCTLDRCVNGECGFVPVADGTSCGYGKECRSGQCVAIEGIIPGLERVTGLNIYVLVLIVLIALGLIYYAYSSYSKK